jgi:hypothetical protein
MNTTAATLPEAPVLLRLYYAMDTILGLQWDGPQDTGGVPIRHYLLEVHHVSADVKETRVVNASASAAGSLTLYDLKESNWYFIRAQSVTRVGSSPWSPLLRAQTLDLFDVHVVGVGGGG